MQIKKVIPSGFCKGVISAIDISKNARLNNPDKPIYILGMIVHNQYITDALKNYNIITLDDSIKTKDKWIDEIDDGIIIFTAHGISDILKQKAISKKLQVIDASCSDVIKTQNIIKERLKDDYSVIYIGKKNHPEAEAVLSISDKIHLVTSLSDIEKLDITGKLFVTNQTTMSIFDIQKMLESIKSEWPLAIIQEEICNATSMRQNAIIKLQDCDLLYVVGDPKSNNSNQLVKIAKEIGIKKAIMIQTALDINIEDLKGVQNIYVTAGASTPTFLTNQVIDSLNYYQNNNTLPNISIDLKKLLD